MARLSLSGLPPPRPASRGTLCAQVGATCWYTAEALSEGGVAVPIGIIDTAIGGQRIEEYMTNSSQQLCNNRSSENIPW